MNSEGRLPQTLKPTLIACMIQLLALDIDGVLTDGSITFTSSGDEIKTFNAKDGLGLRRLQRAGVELAFITGRQSPILERRAEELGITHLYQDIAKKLPVLETLCAELNIPMSSVAYMGDDLPDIPILEALRKTNGLAVCPSDAVPEVLQVCNFVSTKPGGHGAVRELCDWIFQSLPTSLESAQKAAASVVSG